ncbi:transcriptional regulator TrmB [Agromyces sp. SYSU T00194]|uniref:transcriptional regulator TrmB n=1 Tax=Agromyces chitinivorans TaxID=3158560 RepID=UPI0033959F91
MLDVIGLDEVHTAVYRAILADPSVDVADLARQPDLAGVDLAPVIDALEQGGLVARRATDRDRLVASPPSIALRPLLLERERGLSAAHEALVQLSELYRSASARRADVEVVDTVVGEAAIRQRVAQLQAAATTSVDLFVRDDRTLRGPGENVEESRALERGVAYRALVETAVLERLGIVAAARTSARIGEQIRAVGRLPARLVIGDRAGALLWNVSDDEAEEPSALLIHPGALLDLVVAAFEQHWQFATPLTSEGELRSGGEACTDTDLLRLLLLGLTDAAAGAELGISVRTVQRRIAGLMETAGVGTRIQLGAEAVRRGWV